MKELYYLTKLLRRVYCSSFVRKDLYFSASTDRASQLLFSTNKKLLSVVHVCSLVECCVEEEPHFLLKLTVISYFHYAEG